MDEDQSHRDRLRKEHTKRLRLLLYRKARQGDTVDPAVLSEIEDIQQELAGLDMADVPPPSKEVKDAINRRFEDNMDFLIAQFSAITRRQNAVEETVREYGQQHYAAQEWRLQISDAVKQIQDNAALERGHRKRGQWINRTFLVATFIIVLMALSIAGWWLL